MKKVFLSIATVAAMVFTAQAQISIIPKAGVSLGNFAFKEKEEGQKMNLGLVAGAGFNLPVGESGLSVQPEILYTQKGVAVKAEDNGVKATGKNIANIVEVPLLLKYTLGEDAFKFYFNAGPSFGYWVSGKTKSKIEGTGTPLDGERNESYEFDSENDNRLDIGVQAGAGLMYQVGPGSLVFDARYGYGLTNYQKTPEGENKADFKSQSRTVALTIGYAISFGGK